MATIDVRRAHTIGKDKARAAAESVAERLRDKIQISYQWAGDDLRFERTGARGAIHVTDREVHVEIDLSLVLRPMKGKIEGKVHKYLDEALGAA